MMVVSDETLRDSLLQYNTSGYENITDSHQIQCVAIVAACLMYTLVSWII